jgi:hypothetical protein
VRLGLRNGLGAAVLLSCTVAFVVTGCGRGQPSDSPFRSQVTHICLALNRLGSDPQTRSEFEKEQTSARTYLDKLARLHPPTTSEQHTYRDLIAHMNRIYTFHQANESELIKLERQSARPRDPRAAIKRWQRFLRPIARDTSAAYDDVSALHLIDCPSLVGL